jgi:hypothetical protein
MSYCMPVLMTRRHGICTRARVCAAGSNGITCNLESSFNLKALRVEVEAPQTSITSQEIQSMWCTGIGVQSHIPLSPQWSRRHGERPPTRHWLFHSFKQCAPVEYVPARPLRGITLGGCTHTSNCYPHIFPWPQSKVHKTSARHARSSHRHCSPWSGVFMVPDSFSFLVLCFPCHRLFSKHEKNLVFIPEKVRRSISGSKFLGTSFSRVMKNCTFFGECTWIGLSKEFFSKRCLK